MSVNSKMTAIADAIRNLLDISGTMGLDAMASNISSIAKRGAVAGTISTKAEQYIIPAGYHNGNGTVGIADAEQEKLIAENIKNGVTILGVSGTASGDIYAIISVTYPEGSICTCSDGTTTLTAKDTSGKALFNVPSAGTWTVTARTEDGSTEKSIDLTITAAGQVASVALSYSLILYSYGNENTAVTGGWKTRGLTGDGKTAYPATAGTVVKNASNMVWTQPKQSSGILEILNDVDLTEYKTLKIRAAYTGDSFSITPTLVIINRSATKWYTEQIARLSVANGTDIVEKTLDISSLSGSYDIAFGAQVYQTTCVLTVELVELI